MVLFQSLKGQIRILILWVLDLRLSGLSAAPRAGGWFPDLLKLSLSAFTSSSSFPLPFPLLLSSTGFPELLSSSLAVLPSARKTFSLSMIS